MPMNKEELTTKIAKIIMTILPGYWNLQAIPGQDFDSAWADLAVNCKELCSSRAREIVELIEGEKPQPQRWLDKPDKEGYWWKTNNPFYLGEPRELDIVYVMLDHDKVKFFYAADDDEYTDDNSNCMWQYIPPAKLPNKIKIQDQVSSGH
jgi:hypothetical protein